MFLYDAVRRVFENALDAIEKQAPTHAFLEA